ncbi:TlpA disulfide reductase family protein [Draconibacterium halophilum]|uniref:AhpC/TSA family protein n=1 Tax=Draconibacterium halophilum TaxID=2706887 RepID=A0A6C0R9U9_9BACT|nr:TlpA disulfide reductase family protein [Draconibacterium halophilum]QIA07150.1 AhpC/TSA family protein [Draconibacterium halophilum]
MKRASQNLPNGSKIKSELHELPLNVNNFNRMTNMTYRVLFFLVAALLVLGGCKQDKEFTIRGKITHAEDETIVLEELHTTSLKKIAETKINTKGEFEISAMTGIPTFYLLKLSDQNFITLLVDSAETVTIEADAANFDREYNVEGSLGSAQVKMLDSKLKDTRHKLDSLRSLDNLYAGNPEYDNVRPRWAEEYNEIVQEQIEFSTNFVRENPFSMASVLALYQKFNPEDESFIVRDLQVMKTAASALNTIYPKSEQVQALYNNTLQIVRNEQSANMQRFIQEQGDNSPDIVLPDPEGNEVALSSLRGKVVLLQFWAAVDRGSRIQNPVLVEAYKKYHRKGFEIYQVSVDQNRAEWVDAIDQDKLSWINVGDMEGSKLAAAVYNVQNIPFNYLLNEEGEIVAKNLKGPALDKALARLLD